MPEMGILADGAERQRIATELDRNFIVEVAAGTGKTTSLVRRLTALVRSGVPMENLAAVTFTRKAAAHLREAFQEKLEEVRAGETDPVVRALLQKGLDERERAFVGTIHSFCGQMLRERPVEAGVAPDFTEMEEADEALMRDRVWRDYAERLILDEGALYGGLNEVGLDVGQLKDFFASMAANPDVSLVTDPGAERPDFGPVLRDVGLFLENIRGALTLCDLGQGETAQKKLSLLLKKREHLSSGDFPAVAVFLEGFPKKSDVKLKYWPDREQVKGFRDRIETLRLRIDEVLLSWREYVHPRVVAAVEPAVREFAKARREAGYLNFSDLLLMTRGMLRDRPAVRAYFAKRFSRILVDEFQDTDPVQTEILFFLTGEEKTERDWRKLTPRPGSLFIVGDPKQSIYRFRRADMALYSQVRDRINSTGGDLLKLWTNFRSVPAVCSWVDGVFRQLFPATSTPRQAGFVPFSPGRAGGKSPSGVYKLVHQVEKNNADELCLEDARCIADWIEIAVGSGFSITEERGDVPTERPVTWRDFLILLPGKDHMECYSRALDIRGIPCEITGGPGLEASKEIADVLPFLRAVADPLDQASVLAWLRGPLCGIDDETLYRFAQARGGRFSFRGTLPEGTDPRLLEARARLGEARKFAAVMPPASALVRMVEGTGLFALGGVREAGDRNTGSLVRALSLMAEEDFRGGGFLDLVDSLTGGLAGQLGMDIHAGSGNAVRLMNLHQAKGLEAPVVFLARPKAKQKHSIEFNVDRTGEVPQGYLKVTAPNGPFHRKEVARPPHWTEKETEERSFLDVEWKRLLYVAATRAKNILVVSVSEKGGRAYSAWEEFLDDLDTGLIYPGVIYSRPEEKSGQATSWVDAEGVLQHREQKIGELAVPGWEKTSVTALTHSESGPFPFADNGTGMAWGTVLHGILERFANRPDMDLEAAVRKSIVGEGLSEELVADMVGLVEVVRIHPFWKRIRAADKILTEVPFTVATKRDGGEGKSPDTLLLSGIVDLAILEGDTWTLVDYKINNVGNDVNVLAGYYASQISRYVRHWQELTGQSTKGLLWFVETGDFFDESAVPVTPSPARAGLGE